MKLFFPDYEACVRLRLPEETCKKGDWINSKENPPHIGLLQCDEFTGQKVESIDALNIYAPVETIMSKLLRGDVFQVVSLQFLGPSEPILPNDLALHLPVPEIDLLDILKFSKVVPVAKNERDESTVYFRVTYVEESPTWLN